MAAHGRKQTSGIQSSVLPLCSCSGGATDKLSRISAIVPTRSLGVPLARCVTVSVADPLRWPSANVSHATLLVGVHGQPAPVVTVTFCVPTVSGTVAVVGATVEVHDEEELVPYAVHVRLKAVCRHKKAGAWWNTLHSISLTI